MKRKFFVEIQYNGKNYFGFQKNDNKKTIQAEIENALGKLFNETIAIDGSSRTDAGVSAKKFYFVFSVETKLPADRVAFKLNRFLPKDIQCQGSEEVGANFNLRKNILEKTYEYTLYVAPHSKPLLNSFAVLEKNNLNIEKMKECANVLVGTHNYKSFCNVNADTTSFDKTINSIEIIEQDELIKIRISAKNFLFNMVRILVGTLVEAGKGKLTKQDILSLFEIQNRQENPAKTMSAKGLILYDIKLNKENIYD